MLTDKYDPCTEKNMVVIFHDGAAVKNNFCRRIGSDQFTTCPEPDKYE